MIVPIIKEIKILKTPSLPIDGITQDVINIAQDMIDTCHEKKGVGLAAVQIGHHVRMIYVATNIGTQKIMINPIIRKQEKLTTSRQEGCLSQPGRRFDKKRYKRIVVEYYDIKGEPQMYKAHNFEAFCIQHEIDHLDGKLVSENVI